MDTDPAVASGYGGQVGRGMGVDDWE